MILRPHVQEFLQSMAKLYEVYILYICLKKIVFNFKTSAILFYLHKTSFFFAVLSLIPAAVCVLLQLFVYTCAKKEYAEKILDVLDPQRKLFRSVFNQVSVHLCL